ncbi:MULTISPECIES: HesB/IscA family protein [unclassified Xanthobacter]|uniref:HesB/IscA family protein n=1 Tax=unclassified Xanthobacter TaxID=2623496 RepID=UPI001EDD417E|nr:MULTISPECIES: iron-sulfur cluster assembly accessory protein [unclassified Xanthobacter]
MSDTSPPSAKTRARPAVLSITEAAAARLHEILSQQEAGAAVRLGVANGGCAGMSYTMEYTNEIAPLDTVVEEKGVRVVIDSKALLFLLGTEMDFKEDKLAAQFVFNNPNQVSACGCGESVSLVPADASAVGDA